eukprot:7052224-Heterocapsa_arctica.AAC.1
MKDQFNETFDDCKIAEKDGFVVDRAGQMYVYSPVLRACCSAMTFGEVANLRRSRGGSQAPRDRRQAADPEELDG